MLAHCKNNWNCLEVVERCRLVVMCVCFKERLTDLHRYGHQLDMVSIEGVEKVQVSTPSGNLIECKSDIMLLCVKQTCGKC